MRIQSINIKNTGVFIDETIDFPCCRPEGAEIHIFTGPNGSGKSTILHSLAAGFNHVNVTGLCKVAHNDLYKRFHHFEMVSEDENLSEISLVLDNQSTVRSYGCQKCHQMHIDTFESRVKEYQSQMGLNESSSYEFEFALYASSGYRMVDYEKPTNIRPAFNENPLYQSLEFEKKQSHTISIEEWIKQALQNKYAAMGMASENGNNINAAIHAQVIDRITDAIRQVVGSELEFILQLQPSKVKFRYGKSKNELEFNLLADGLKSLISWMIDLAKMLDSLHWKNKSKSILDQNVIIFLDEIEVHLHPLWQRKVLPMVTKLFPNAQIFCSSHSPFIINSVDGAWIYKLQTNEKGNASVMSKHQSNTAISYLTEYISTFGVEEEFGEETQQILDKFQEAIDNLQANSSDIDVQNIKQLAQILLNKNSIAIDNTVGIALRKLKRLKNIDIAL
jgi:predicted ATP-binding protein involved in virulence